MASSWVQPTGPISARSCTSVSSRRRLSFRTAFSIQGRLSGQGRRSGMGNCSRTVALEASSCTLACHSAAEGESAWHPAGRKERHRNRYGGPFGWGPRDRWAVTMSLTKCASAGGAEDQSEVGGTAAHRSKEQSRSKVARSTSEQTSASSATSSTVHLAAALTRRLCRYNRPLWWVSL